MTTTYSVRFNYTMFVNFEPVTVCDGWEDFNTLEEAQAAVKAWEANTDVMEPYATIQEFPKL